MNLDESFWDELFKRIMKYCGGRPATVIKDLKQRHEGDSTTQSKLAELGTDLANMGFRANAKYDWRGHPLPAAEREKK